jgi:hypothetical protein
LTSDVRGLEDKLDLWLINGAERFRRDPGVCEALLALAKHPNSRQCLVLIKEILETPNLAERLLHVLRPEKDGGDREEPTPPRARPASPRRGRKP